MKIIRIIARLNVGGPSRHVVWLTKAFRDEEFQTVLLTGTVPEGEENMSYFAAENDVVPIYIPEMSRELSLNDISSLWKVFRQIWREKPDIIHTHTAKAGTIGRVAGFLYRWLRWKEVKIVHTFHGHIFHSYYGNFKTKIFLIIEKALARFATDKIIVISEQQKKEINEYFGIGSKEQFVIIPLGIDLTKFTDAEQKRHILRAEIGVTDDEIVVGLVGRLTEIKNIPLFLKAACLYKERKNDRFPKLKFVIIGNGHLREKLEAETFDSGIEGLVKFLGNRTDSEVFYSGLDIVALTSLNEGTPLSLIEAMANSKPVISTAVGGVVDLLGKIESQKDGFNICERGVSVASEDAEGFFKGLLYLVQDKDLQVKLGIAGKKFVLKNYDKERLIADIADLYRSLVKKTDKIRQSKNDNL
jgi:glycosyltransferase involved in cell wall biosynthesis